jgi:hypothetical protein
VHIVQTPPNNPQRFKVGERVRHVLKPSRVGTITELLDNQQRAAVAWDDNPAFEVSIAHLQRAT